MDFEWNSVLKNFYKVAVMLQIESATTPQHIAAIEQLAKEIWNEHYTPIIGDAQVRYMLNKYQSAASMLSQIESEGYKYFSLLDDQQLIGYLSFQQRNATLFLSKLYLEKQSRGKGFSREALQFLDHWGTRNKCDKIELTVNKYNANSIAAYQKLGFEVVNEAVFDIGEGFVMDDFIMQRPISSPSWPAFNDKSMNSTTLKLQHGV